MSAAVLVVQKWASCAREAGLDVVMACKRGKPICCGLVWDLLSPLTHSWCSKGLCTMHSQAMKLKRPLHHMHVQAMKQQGEMSGGVNTPCSLCVENHWSSQALANAYFRASHWLNTGCCCAVYLHGKKVKLPKHVARFSKLAYHSLLQLRQTGPQCALTCFNVLASAYASAKSIALKLKSSRSFSLNPFFPDSLGCR